MVGEATARDHRPRFHSLLSDGSHPSFTGIRHRSHHRSGSSAGAGGNQTGPAGVTASGTTRRRRCQPTMTASPAPSTTSSTEPVLPGEGAEWIPPSWDEVVREHADRVYRLAYRLTGNQHDAEDLTQETFVRVFRSLSSYKPGTFEGWLHRITTNLFLDMARRRSRVRMEALPEDNDRLEGDDLSPEEIYDENHLDPDLQAALDELPPEFRAAVVLCDVEGLSYEEIGATLGRSEEHTS